MGDAYKITLISLTNCPRVLNLIQSNAMTWYSNVMVSDEKLYFEYS